jgi:hypothetical protein
VTLDRGALTAAAGRGVRGHVLVGAEDEAIDVIRETCTLLEDVGVTTTLNIVAGCAHDYPDDFGERLTAALDDLLHDLPDQSRG